MKKIYIITISVITISIAFFAYNFFTHTKTQETEAALSRNGLTLDLNFGNNDGTATPTVYDTSGSDRHATSTAGVAPTCNNNLCDFDGGDYMTADATGVFNSSEISYALKFSPDVIAGSSTNFYFFDVSGTSANQVVLFHSSSNLLYFYIGGGNIGTVSLSEYEKYWKVGQENVLIFTSESGNSNAWLNGGHIMINDDSTWTPNNVGTSLTLGARYDKILLFNGKMHYLKVWNRLLTDNEVANLSADRKTSVQAPSRTGLIGHWNMDKEDVNGTNIYDKSGNGYNATTADAPVFATGKIGQSININNDVAERITLPSNSALDINTGDYTFSAWVKVATNGAHQTIFTEGSPSSIDGTGIIIYHTPTGAFEIRINDGSASYSTFTGGSNVKIIDNDWHLFTFVFSYTGNQNIYIDGVPGTEAANTQTSGNIGNATGQAIGALTAGLFPLNGSIDDVRIYNYALSAEEVSELYNSAKTNYTQAPSRTGLVGWWDIDAKSINGTNVYDKSGNGSHAVYSGGSGSPTSTIGKVGQAISFQNNASSNGGLTVTNFSSPDQFTFGLWVKKDGTMAKISYIIDNEGIGALNPGFGLLINPTTTYPVIYYDDGTVQRAVQNTTLNILDNQWHFVVGTKNLSDTVTLYVDGVYKASTTVATGDVSSNDGLVIGWSGLASGSGFDGSIDDVRIYNYALSAQEVAGLYNATKKIYIK